MTMPPRISYKFRERALWNLPKVLTLYYGQNKTVQEVAKEVKMSPMTVSNLLKEYGKGLRPKHGAPLK